MTFSSSVREEISHSSEKLKLCCSFAFLYGAFCFSFLEKEDRITISTNAENIEIIENTCKFIASKKKFSFSINANKITINKGFLRYFTIAEIENTLLKCSNCKAMFLRGLYLSHGTINDPYKSYRVELVFKEESHANQVMDFLETFGFTFKITRRKDRYVLYSKSSEVIGDLLATIGATSCAFEVMNSKIVKDLRNSANRVRNCDSGNINKTVSASKKYCEAINELIRLDLFDELPDSLKEMALKRIEFDNLGFSELGKRFNPPISKSAVYHKLEKILEFYEKNKDKEK